jgi:hypothetical protein
MNGHRFLPFAFVAAVAAGLGFAPSTADAGALEDIAAANAGGRSVFVALVDGPDAASEAVRAAAREAHGLVKDSALVEVNRRDPAHAPALARLGLAESPAPLVVLVGKKGGVVAQERAATGAAQRLAALVPAPTAIQSTAAANAAGRPVFLVVTEGPGPGLEAARASALKAQSAVPTAVVVELDRRDPAEADGVTKYRLAAAPLPLVLVVASNGVPAGAAKPGDAAPARLAGLVPTRAKADYLQVLGQQRVAIVLFTRASMAERSPLFENAGTAVQQLAGKATLVLVDLDDAAETRFVGEFKVDPATAQPLVYFVNPKGQVLGTLTGASTVEQIVKTATKKAHTCSDPNCDCEKHK